MEEGAFLQPKGDNYVHHGERAQWRAARFGTGTLRWIRSPLPRPHKI